MKNLHVLAACGSFFLVTALSAADAKSNWDEHCAKCHGPDGKGQTKMGKKLDIRDYTDAKVQSSFTDEEALKAMKEGTKSKEGKQLMKPVEDLTEEDMKALVTFVRAFKA